MAADYVEHWRKFLRYFDIRGALPVTFRVDDPDNYSAQIIVTMTAPSVDNYAPVQFSRRVEIPPFVLSQSEMVRLAQDWAKYMYIHELREQTYLDGVRVDIPDEDH